MSSLKAETVEHSVRKVTNQSIEVQHVDAKVLFGI